MHALAPEVDGIIEAEIVRPESQVRFGLRTMMIVTALCSVQFAVMNYFGVLWGFLIGGLFCLAAMTLLTVTGLWFGRTEPELSSRLDRLILRFVVALTAIVVSGGLSGGGILLLQELEPLRQGWWLERQLGLKTTRELAWLDEGVVEVLRIQSVKPGLPGDQAGLKAGDQIHPQPSLNEFYKTLQSRRGQDYDLTVYRGGSVLNKLDGLTEVDVTISIPSK